MPIDNSLLKDLSITYKQKREIVLKKKYSDCFFSGNVLHVKLTQEDTLLFIEGENVEIQIKLLTTNNEVLISDKIVVKVEEVLDKEVFDI